MLRRAIGLEAVLPLVLFLAAAAALIGLRNGQARYETAQIRVETAVTGNQVALRLSAWIRDRLAVAEYFAGVLGDRDHIDAADFRREAARLEAVFPGFQALNFIDPGRVIRIVVPETPNLAALGKNLDQHPEPSVPAALQRSETSASLTRSTVIDLLQGGKGLATYRAIRHEDGRLIGFLNAVFRVQVLVDNCLSEPGLREEFWFRVVEPDGRLAYQTGPSPADMRYAITVPVPITEEPWLLEICPTAAAPRHESRAGAGPPPGRRPAPCGGADAGSLGLPGPASRPAREPGQVPAAGRERGGPHREGRSRKGCSPS